MSKELEALEYLKNRISTLALNHKIGNRDIANLEVKDIVMGIETHVMPIFEKALTPPTADEVCKALSKWVKGNIPDIWNYKVYYDKEGFHYYNSCGFEEYLVEYEQIDKTITLSVFLPPHLITLIGRFYKGENK